MFFSSRQVYGAPAPFQDGPARRIPNACARKALLRRENLAATGAAAGKHLATILGLHASTEAMHLSALTLFGLERHPHCFSHPLFVKMKTLSCL
jgi:hypothetical protein